MVSLVSLWLPIVVSAALVFVASSVIHMVLTYHQKDFGRLADEDGVMDALRGFAIPPGDYVVPHAGTSAAMKTPEFQEKMNRGPVIFMTVLPNGVFQMGSSLVFWFGFCLLVSVFAGYVATQAHGPGAEYLPVFQIVGTTAFAGYGLALLQNSIWYKRNWAATARSVFDALVYAVLTAGIFGWRWPS